jgi:hypothetical protein
MSRGSDPSCSGKTQNQNLQKEQELLEQKKREAVRIELEAKISKERLQSALKHQDQNSKASKQLPMPFFRTRQGSSPKFLGNTVLALELILIFFSGQGIIHRVYGTKFFQLRKAICF